MCVRLLHLKWNIKHFIIRYARIHTIFKLKLHYSLITLSKVYTHTKAKIWIGFLRYKSTIFYKINQKLHYFFSDYLINVLNGLLYLWKVWSDYFFAQIMICCLYIFFKLYFNIFSFINFCIIWLKLFLNQIFLHLTMFKWSFEQIE